MKDPITDDELVINTWSNIEIITLPKASESVGQTFRIRNLSFHTVTVQPSPGDSFADEIYIEQLKTIAATAHQTGKDRFIWEFANEPICGESETTQEFKFRVGGKPAKAWVKIREK